MTKFRFMFVLVIVSWTVSFSQQDDAKIQECLVDMQKGLCERAVNNLSKMNVSQALVQPEMALANLCAGNKERAFQEFTQNLETTMGEWNSILRGLFFVVSDEYEIAANEFESYLTLDTTAIWTHYLIGVCYNQMGDTSKAWKHYSKIRKEYPDMPPIRLVSSKMEAFKYAGYFFGTTNLPLLSRILYNEVLREDPYEFTAIYDIGTILYEGGDFKSAIHFLEPVVDYVDQRYKILNLLGRAYRRDGRIQDAINCYKDALIEQPEDLLIINNLAYAYRITDSLEAAEGVYLSALEIDNTYPQSLYGLGAVYCQMSRFEDAAGMVERLSQIGTREATAFHDLLKGYVDNRSTDVTQ
jgi:tetratricopeptide (TPR) repeat protein